MIDLGLSTSDIITILENGTEIKKRKKGIIEKWYHKGKFIYVVAVEDYGDYWLIRPIIKATKKNLKLLEGKK